MRTTLPLSCWLVCMLMAGSGNGLAQAPASEDSRTPLEKIRIVALSLNKVPLEEAIEVFRQRLTGTTAQNFTFRFIEQPEVLEGFKPEIGRKTKVSAQWRTAPVSIKQGPSEASNVLANLTARVGARFEERGREVWIFPDLGTFEKLQTRTFQLNYNFVSPQNVTNVPDYLRRGGVRSYEGTSVRYEARHNRVVATNTPEQLDLIEVLLD